jgi:outer membrane biosynthesis protein TonB
MMMRTTTLLMFCAATLVSGATAQARDTASVQGNLTKDQIRDVVRGHIDEVRYCYNQVLQSAPETKAKLVVDFTIGSDGSVKNSAVGAGSQAPAQLGQCVNAAVLTWTFPAPNGGGEVVVAYPFLFEPG